MSCCNNKFDAKHYATHTNGIKLNDFKLYNYHGSINWRRRRHLCLVRSRYYGGRLNFDIYSKCTRELYSNSNSS